jgi:hypothetical protein
MKDELENSCTLQAGYLYEIDQMYSKSEQVLCSSNCPCNANKTLWSPA